MCPGLYLPQCTRSFQQFAELMFRDVSGLLDLLEIGAWILANGLDDGIYGILLSDAAIEREEKARLAVELQPMLDRQTVAILERCHCENGILSILFLIDKETNVAGRIQFRATTERGLWSLHSGLALMMDDDDSRSGEAELFHEISDLAHLSRAVFFLGMEGI